MTTEMQLIELFGVKFTETMYGRSGLTEESKHKVCKKIAQELRSQHGEGAYLYCAERLSTETTNIQLWRDVLSYLDKTKGEAKCED